MHAGGARSMPCTFNSATRNTATGLQNTRRPKPARCTFASPSSSYMLRCCKIHTASCSIGPAGAGTRLVLRSILARAFASRSFRTPDPAKGPRLVSSRHYLPPVRIGSWVQTIFLFLVTILINFNICSCLPSVSLSAWY